MWGQTWLEWAVQRNSGSYHCNYWTLQLFYGRVVGSQPFVVEEWWEEVPSVWLGNLSSFAGKFSSTCAVFRLLQLMGTTVDFWKFVFSPIASPNNDRSSTRADTSNLSGVRKSAASSAYKEIQIPGVRPLILLKIPPFRCKIEEFLRRVNSNDKEQRCTLSILASRVQKLHLHGMFSVPTLKKN